MQNGVRTLVVHNVKCNLDSEDTVVIDPTPHLITCTRPASAAAWRGVAPYPVDAFTLALLVRSNSTSSIRPRHAAQNSAVPSLRDVWQSKHPYFCDCNSFFARATSPVRIASMIGRAIASVFPRRVTQLLIQDVRSLIGPIVTNQKRCKYRNTFATPKCMQMRVTLTK